MSVLNNIQKTSKQVVKSSEDYVNATKEYVELKTFQQISIAFTLFFKSFIIGTLLLLAFILLIVESIVLLMDVLGSLHYALLFTTAIIFIIALFLYIFRKPLIESPVVRMVSKTFFSTE